MDDESMFDTEPMFGSENGTTTATSDLSSTTAYSALTTVLVENITDVLIKNITKTTKKACKNVISYEGDLYICFEKVNFLLMIATLFFILFIMFSVIEKRLRTPSSYLILSLATTDLIVGGITVPIRSLNEIYDYGTWRYGIWLCDIRVFIDKICVYSSLLHVLVIAIDRYRTVSSLNYSLTRSGKQIFFYVLSVWTVSSLLAAAPIFGWRDGEAFQERIKGGSCFVNKLFSLNFTVWLVIFVIPCTATAILYIKVYIIIKNRLVSNKPGVQPAKTSSSSNFTSSTTVTNQSNQTNGSRSKQSNGVESSSKDVSNDKSNSKSKMEAFEISDQGKSLKDERKKSENKASKTLILMTICIVICWSPFFTMYTISSIFGLEAGSTYNIWFKLSIWMGYANSICNMSIYAFMNPLYSKAISNLFKFK